MPDADPNRTVMCLKLGKELPALKEPPFPTEFGQLLYEKISKEAWDLWLQESVRYINTYRIDLATKEGTAFLLKQMKIWFGFEEGDLAETAWTPEKQ
ncbi:MAG: oxidative damage protection protein [Myxococcales bacterium]|nr:MAG: oxidative damage protection protein [Myxococcales bacterium]